MLTTYGGLYNTAEVTVPPTSPLSPTVPAPHLLLSPPTNSPLFPSHAEGHFQATSIELTK